MSWVQQARLTMWAIGLSVGAGIYALIGDIVKASGTWAPGMFAAASFVMLCNGYALAGTARRFPHAGSILTIVRETMHPWAAVAFEVLRLVEGGLALCVTAKLTVHFAYGLVAGPDTQPSPAAEVALLAAVALLVHRGLDTAMDLGNLGTFVEVSGLLLVIFAAAVSPAAPPSTSTPVDFALGPATSSITQIVFAFGGIQGVLDMAGDVEDVGRVLPRVVMCAVVVTGLLYTCVCAAALSMVGVDGLTSRAVSPLGMVLEKVGFPLGTQAALALVSLFSVGNTCMGIFAFVSRIAFSLGQHAAGKQGFWPPLVYTSMVLGTALVGNFCDVFVLAGRVGVMLLVTFVVVDYAFLTAVAATYGEKIVGTLAFAASCALVVVDQIA